MDNEEEEYTEDELKEKEKKVRKWQKKTEEFMAEMSMDVMGEEHFSKVEEAVKRLFKKEGVLYQKGTIKAFKEGLLMAFTNAHTGEDPQFIMHMIMVLTAVSKRMTDEMNEKVENAMKGSKLK